MRLPRLRCRDSARRERGRHPFTKSQQVGRDAAWGGGHFLKGAGAKAKDHHTLKSGPPGVGWETHGGIFSLEGEG